MDQTSEADRKKEIDARKKALSRHIKGARQYIRDGYDVQEYAWDNDLPDDMAEEVYAAVREPEESEAEKRKAGAAKRLFPEFK
ncbi:MAG: hypothetical protein LBU23_08890 [Planctomycetota bacterium]|jgi:hypothetical protein|nr:hypothetical protein [Planctomycetota bacterium]